VLKQDGIYFNSVLNFGGIRPPNFLSNRNLTLTFIRHDDFSKVQDFMRGQVKARNCRAGPKSLIIRVDGTLAPCFPTSEKVATFHFDLTVRSRDCNRSHLASSASEEGTLSIRHESTSCS
jgi:hypothetical protein